MRSGIVLLLTVVLIFAVLFTAVISFGGIGPFAPKAAREARQLRLAMDRKAIDYRSFSLSTRANCWRIADAICQAYEQEHRLPADSKGFARYLPEGYGLPVQVSNREYAFVRVWDTDADPERGGGVGRPTFYYQPLYYTSVPRSEILGCLIYGYDPYRQSDVLLEGQERGDDVHFRERDLKR